MILIKGLPRENVHNNISFDIYEKMLDSYTKGKIVGMREMGHSYRDISLALGVPETSVKRNFYNVAKQNPKNPQKEGRTKTGLDNS